MELDRAALRLQEPLADIERAIARIDTVLEAMADSDDQEELSNITSVISLATDDLERWIKERMLPA